MNIKKKNLVLIVIATFVFATLLSCGIFAVVSKSVSFNLALKLDPQIFFSLSMRIDYNGDGDYADTQNNINESSSYKIFDNKTGESVATWATVNQNCIVLNQVLAGNILSNLTINSRFEITVTNLTAKSNAVEYLNLTLNYNGAEEVFKIDNGYGAVNMEYGVASGDTSAAKTFTLIPQTTLLDGYIQIPFKAEIDTEKRYTATITTTNCEVVSAPVILPPNKVYTAEFRATHIYDPVFSYVVTIKGSSYATSENTNLLTIPANAVIGDITITVTATRSQYWSGTAAAAFSGGDGTEANPFQIAHADELGLMSWLVNNQNGASSYSGSATLNNKTVTVSATCGTDITFGTAYYVLTDNIYLNKGYENYATWEERGEELGLHQWVPIGSTSPYFCGNLDGQNNSIYGMYIYFSSCAGGFVYRNYGIVQNIDIASGYVHANYCGGFCYYNSGILKCITNYSVNVFAVGDASYSTTGGIAGCSYDGVINGCINYANVYAKTSEVGGIAGYHYQSALIINCLNFGNIVSIGALSSGHSNVAGIAGMCSHGGWWFGGIINCANFGTIKGNDRVAGIAGHMRIYAIVENVFNIGKIYGEKNVGSIASTPDSYPDSCNFAYYLEYTASIHGVYQKGIGSGTTGSYDTATDVTTASKTDAYMRSQAFVDVLNQYITTDMPRDGVTIEADPDGATAKTVLPTDLRLWEITVDGYPTLSDTYYTEE